MAEKRAFLDPILDIGENECVVCKGKVGSCHKCSVCDNYVHAFCGTNNEDEEGFGAPNVCFNCSPTTVNNAMDKNDEHLVVTVEDNDHSDNENDNSSNSDKTNTKDKKKRKLSSSSVNKTGIYIYFFLVMFLVSSLVINLIILTFRCLELLQLQCK